MKLKTNIRNTIIEVICLLYILLFFYAAISKLLDYHNFRIQLGQSPILSSVAGLMSIFIPILELGIAILLVFRYTRFLGLLASFTLMVLFSFYIYIILHYSAFVPCSCGGILEKMTWNQHLAFNVFFTIMAGIAFVILPNYSGTGIEKTEKIDRPKLRLGLLLGCGLFGGVFMGLLFNFSENIIHYKNTFIRRFPQHVAQEVYQIDLKFNSYYFAGNTHGKIYLGNFTAPLKVLEIDTASKAKKNFQIHLKQKELPFVSPKIKVFDKDFFVYEGTVPYVFKGNIANWHANLKSNSGYYFSNVEPMDSTNLAIRYLKPKSGENALGNMDLKDTLSAKFNSGLLEKQFDGIFDTDGTLLYNAYLKKIIYVYYYRNEYLVVNPNLELAFKGNTIDTVSKAKVELIQYKNSRMKTFAKPPLTVNKLSASYGNLLYINSVLPGLYESERIWKIASIVDVYDLTNKSYRSSFPVYDVDGKKVRSMLADGNFLYVLIDTKLICYKLRKHITQNRAVNKSKT